ncbi:YdeI/OmpD-associated family protein [Roseibacillus ishigakijimensis]|uniref:DUF1905 domain-containing protein n=1 Tax=Roseibacillus ishigakijimensis TaxID=454146 RepID=A0A934RS54_9BACT|nr:YdeI/OmpD-associated family protein [Roseibacillus ishigakijimensis]MBK1834656.1 DUF1905 domain-containing protein [Roseibacillus ishigakijimensis]
MSSPPLPPSSFEATLLRPAKSQTEEDWTFLLLPQEVSDLLPRRGRTTVAGTLNGHPFQATLEPDGKLGHWLRVEDKLRAAAGLEVGRAVKITLAPVAKEPEPAIPADWAEMLAASPEARATWQATTPLARLDWIHWLTSAKQHKTRCQRLENARDMLAKGKKRVCCFDPSGFYSKAFRAPEAE